MRSTAKVTVSLSLLNVAEVNLYSAIDSKEEVKFNQLCSKCHSRIKYQTVCSNCNREIIDKKSELVKGYEINKGNYVTTPSFATIRPATIVSIALPRIPQPLKGQFLPLE